eukprot:GHVR01095799.1.p1 GENE.GHVR01095799.1~~GHVR01095799.1.p1  ORF type:complete len:111 (+),score=35.57 GHVR01095799.1:559-891(+)
MFLFADVVCVSGKSVREASVVVRLLKFVTVVCEPVPPLVELDRHGTLHPHIQVIFHVMCVYVCTARILESVCVCVCVCNARVLKYVFSFSKKKYTKDFSVFIFFIFYFFK